jgi:hypothetical protein
MGQLALLLRRGNAPRVGRGGQRGARARRGTARGGGGQLGRRTRRQRARRRNVKNKRVTHPDNVKNDYYYGKSVLLVEGPESSLRRFVMVNVGTFFCD